MANKNLIYAGVGLGLIFLLKRRPEAVLPLVLDEPSPGRKKGRAKANAAIHDVNLGSEGEKIFSEIKNLDYPPPGWAPEVDIAIPDQSSRRTKLYRALANVIDAKLSSEQLVELYTYLGQLKKRTPRQQIIFNATRILIKE